MLVMVKSLLSREKGHREDFKQEIDMFAKSSNDSIVQLLAVSSESQPLLAIYEYCEWVRSVYIGLPNVSI